MDSLMERAAPVAAPEPGLPPAALLAQLRRAAIPIAACIVLGAAVACLYARTLPKAYSAYGMVAVEGDRMAIPELQGALRSDETPDPMPIVHTEVLALSARPLVEAVAGQLHLEQDPEFNAALRPPTAIGRLKDWLRGLLPGAADNGHAPDAPVQAKDALLGAVQHNLLISQDNRSLVIGIGFAAHDPELAARFVNTLIADYIDARAQRRVAADLGASGVMSQRIDQVRADIEHIEARMRDLRQSSGQVGLPAGSVGQQQLQDLATAASRATLDRSQIEANWERASALSSGGSSDALASVLGSETISRLREQESQDAEKVADLQQRYGSAYPALRSAQADLSSTRREIGGETHRIVASLATQLKVARAHEADVLAQLAAARAAGVSAQNVQAQLDQLQQDAATRRDLYRTLLERAQQTTAQPAGAQVPDVRVLSPAAVPGSPSAPNMKLAAGFGGVGGGLLAAIAALAFVRRLGPPLDAVAFARGHGLHVIATLPAREARHAADRMLEDAPGSALDTLRDARTRLGQLSRSPPRVVGFAGGQPGDVAAVLACAYARASARGGQRVLLADQDARSAAIPRLLAVPGGRLAELAAGTAAWRDCLVVDRVPGLDTLTGAAGGSADALPLGPVGLENLLADSRADYDLVVLGAPAAAAAGAAQLARSADVMVVVLDERRMDEALAAEACARLRGLSRSPLAAIVLTRA